jgi:hypothetical protein
MKVHASSVSSNLQSSLAHSLVWVSFSPLQEPPSASDW